MVSLNRPLTIRVGDWPLQLIGKASNVNFYCAQILCIQTMTISCTSSVILSTIYITLCRCTCVIFFTVISLKRSLLCVWECYVLQMSNYLTQIELILNLMLAPMANDAV